MKTLAAALLILATASASARADDKATKAPEGDLGKLQGTWTGKVGPNKDIPIVMTIKDKAVTLKITTPDGDDIELKGEFKLNQDAKPHKTLDWSKFTTPNGDDIPDNLAIYKIEADGDTFTLCSGGPGNDRPTEFKAGDDRFPSLSTLKRKKP